VLPLPQKLVNFVKERGRDGVFGVRVVECLVMGELK
jgi:hypothetical protein